MTTIDPILVGAAPDDGNGDLLRNAFIKVNSNEANINAGKQEKLTKVVTVNTKADFPTPSAGVITLDADTIYLIGNDINFGTDRLVFQDRSSLVGIASVSSLLTYTGTGAFFTWDDAVIYCMSCRVDCANGAWLDGNNVGNQVVRFEDMQIEACDTIGSMSGSYLARFTYVSFKDIKTDGLSLAGTCRDFLFGPFISNLNGGTLFDLGTTVFDSFNLDRPTVNHAAGTTILSGLADSGNIAVGGIGTIENGRFSGDGTILNNIDPDGDIRWFSVFNDDIPNTAPGALMYLSDNATPTDITDTDPTLVAGTWTTERSSQFDTTAAGRATYKGENDRAVIIDVIGTLDPDDDNDLAICVAVNGTAISATCLPQFVKANDSETLSTFWEAVLSTDDYVEVFVQNVTQGDSDILASDVLLRIR